MPFSKKFKACILHTLVFAVGLVLLVSNWNQIASVYRTNLHSKSRYLALRRDSIRTDAQIAQEMSQKVRGETAPADEPKVESWIDRQARRKQHLNDICRENPSLRMNLTNVIHNNKRILWPYIVDDKYRILYGFISKVGSTPWKSAFLVLKGTFKSVAEIPGWRAHDPSLKKLSQYSPEEIEYRLQNYTTFMFVRDPLARVLSAYRNKFDGVIQAFRKSYGRRIIERYREKPSKLELETGNVTFAEFVRFITDKNATNNMDGHWMPIHQMVLPCNIHYDYLGKLETWTEDTEQIVKYLKIDHLIHFPALDRNASHHDETFNRYYKNIDQNAIQKLYDLYSLDFQLFGYPMPADLKERKNILLN